MPTIKSSSLAYEFAIAAAKELKESANDIDDKPRVNLRDDPRRRVSGLDYAKFDLIAEELDREERKKEKEEADYRRAVAGCAHDHSAERQIYEKPTSEKLRAAERFRGEGNAAFKQKNFEFAALNYRKALLQFDYTFPETAEETEWMNREKLAAHLNMAMCKINQQEWEEALTQCRLALEIEPNNAKALYRRGLTYLAQDQFENAELALRKVAELMPDDKCVTTCLVRLAQKRERYAIRQRKVYAAMLGTSTELPDSIPLDPSSPPAVAVKTAQEHGDNKVVPHTLMQDGTLPEKRNNLSSNSLLSESDGSAGDLSATTNSDGRAPPGGDLCGAAALSAAAPSARPRRGRPPWPRRTDSTAAPAYYSSLRRPRATTPPRRPAVPSPPDAQRADGISVERSRQRGARQRTLLGVSTDWVVYLAVGFSAVAVGVAIALYARATEQWMRHCAAFAVITGCVQLVGVSLSIGSSFFSSQKRTTISRRRGGFLSSTESNSKKTLWQCVSDD